MGKIYRLDENGQDCGPSGGGEVLVVGLGVLGENGNLVQLDGSVFSNCEAGGLDVTLSISVGAVQVYQGPGTVSEIVTIPSGLYQGVQLQITAPADDLYSPSIMAISGFDGTMGLYASLSAQDNCNSQTRTVSFSLTFQDPTAVFTIQDLGDNVFQFDASGSLDNGCPGSDAFTWSFPNMTENVDFNYVAGYGPNDQITRIDASNYAVSPGGAFTIDLLYETACGSNTATAQSDTTGGGGDCDDITFPGFDQCFSDVEASTSGNVTTFTWNNVKESGVLPVPNVTVASTANTGATIQWPALAGAQTYTLRYRTSPSGTWTQITGITGTGTVSQVLTGLAANTAYDVQVRAVYPAGTSDWSTQDTFTTGQIVTSSDGIKMGANQFLNTPLNVLTSEDGAVPLQLMRIYANTVNTTANATHSSDPYNPSFDPADGFSGLNIHGYLDSLASAGHGILYCNEGAPWTTPDYGANNRTGSAFHGLPANDPAAIYQSGDASIDKSQYRQLAQLCAIQAVMWGPASGDIHGLTSKTGILANVRGNIQINADYFRNGGGIQLYNEEYEHWEGSDHNYSPPAQLVADLGIGNSETRKGGDWAPEVSAAITHAVCDAVGAVNTEVVVYAPSDVMFDPDQFARWKWYWDNFNGGQVPGNLRYAIHHYQHTGGMNNSNYKQLIDFGNRPLAPDTGGFEYSDMEDLMRTATGLGAAVGLSPDKFGIYEIGPDVDDRPWNGSGSGGPNVVDPIGSLDKQDVQSSWLLRSAIHTFRTGMDEFVMYAIRDANEATSAGNRQGWLFDTSGLTYGNYQPTKTWYDYMLMARYLQGSLYDQTVANNNGDNTVRIDRFEDTTAGRAVYTIYKNTQNDSQSTNIQFDLQPGESSPMNYKRNGSSSQGTVSTPTLGGSTVTVNTVDEHVQYIVVNI